MTFLIHTHIIDWVILKKFFIELHFAKVANFTLLPIFKAKDIWFMHVIQIDIS